MRAVGVPYISHIPTDREVRERHFDLSQQEKNTSVWLSFIKKSQSAGTTPEYANTNKSRMLQSLIHRFVHLLLLLLNWWTPTKKRWKREHERWVYCTHIPWGLAWGYDMSTCLLCIMSIGQVLGPICPSQQSLVCFWCQDGLRQLSCSQTPPYALTSLTSTWASSQRVHPITTIQNQFRTIQNGF